MLVSYYVVLRYWTWYGAQLSLEQSFPYAIWSRSIRFNKRWRWPSYTILHRLWTTILCSNNWCNWCNYSSCRWCRTIV
jgi:hypothetical protein